MRNPHGTAIGSMGIGTTRQLAQGAALCMAQSVNEKDWERTLVLSLD